MLMTTLKNWFADPSLSCYSDSSTRWRSRTCDSVRGYRSCYTRYRRTHLQWSDYWRHPVHHINHSYPQLQYSLILSLWLAGVTQLLNTFEDVIDTGLISTGESYWLEDAPPEQSVRGSTSAILRWVQYNQLSKLHPEVLMERSVGLQCVWLVRCWSGVYILIKTIVIGHFVQRPRALNYF